MDTVQKGVIALLGSAVTGRAHELPEGFDLGEAYTRVRAHHMASLVYAGAVNCGIDRNLPVMQRLFQSYCRAIQVSERQMRELDRVFSAFEARKIDYLPLKGCIMKAEYPKPELRMMGDADVLIRTEQYERIKPIMQELGFTGGEESEQHFEWNSPSLCLELHKNLVIPNVAGDYAYLHDGWRHAQTESGMRWGMDDVHTFAFLFTHFARHFSAAGIGCRHVVDLWVYLRTHPDMDAARLKDVMEKLDLWRFYSNIRRLIAVWFEGAEADDMTELLTQVIFDNGSWGTGVNAALSLGVWQTGGGASTARSRAEYVLCRVFPPRESLEIRFPVLRGRPWLLPAVWCVYVFRKLAALPSILGRHGRQLGMLTQDAIIDRKRFLETVGLSRKE